MSGHIVAQSVLLRRCVCLKTSLQLATAKLRESHPCRLKCVPLTRSLKGPVVCLEVRSFPSITNMELKKGLLRTESSELLCQLSFYKFS
uniref:Putative secreted protein n=1 Tax=Ixodes ricinus TaxID=34613 RepID=A0A6B0UAY2_IXORI